MYLGYTEEQEALRDELVAYYDKLLTPEVQEALHLEHGVGPVTSEIMRQMGADGWLGIGWPEEYGGQGRSQIEQFIFFDESMRMGAPVPMLTINTVGPTIMEFGTDEQKQDFLPRILAGEIHFCIGYSEPEAGTDLAALRTRRVRDGDEYVINGQKIWTSLASDVDYCWLAVRTDPDAPEARGHLDHRRRHGRPGHHGRPAPPAVRPTTSTPSSTTTCGCPPPGWSARRTRAGSCITNQLNHERVTHRRARHARARLRRRRRVGGRHQGRRRASGSSTRSGCRSTWPGSTPVSSSCA